MALLSKASGADPLGLLALLHERPDVFDSLWYGFYPPKRPGEFSVDDVLNG